MRMRQLSKFLRESEVTQAQFAARVGLSQATVSKLASGTLSPSLQVAVRIERATGGAVCVASWVDLQDIVEPFPEAKRGAA